MPAHPLLLDIAAQSGCQDLAQCGEVLERAAATQQSAVATLLDEKLVDERLFLRELSGRLGVPWREESDERAPEMNVPAPLRERFPPRIALRHHLFPAGFDEERGELTLLTYDPFNLLARQAVAQAIPDRIRWEMSTRRGILQGLRQGYGIGAETFEEILESGIDFDALAALKQETNVLDLDDSEASVVKFVNQIIREALEQRATDIHVEPLEDDLRIRYRIDGVLHEIPVPPQIKLLQSSVIARLKIMAHLDIAERRMPQDGRINLELAGQAIDVRVATIPSVTGESVSLRLLGQERFEFERLGLADDDEERIRSLLAMPNGIVLLTGPTGCGKSTTLYTFLNSLNTHERRIVTIEDPVEHKVPGVIQIAVKPEIDLTFARGLRSILRGDPNVVMVGEMRDLETAEIAIRSALTGHLVFSTLHTNDAIGGVMRLIDMGVEPFLVAAAVRAFIAQRLVRRNCPRCLEPAHYPEPYLREIGFPIEQASLIRKGAGCDHCRGTGYLGRAAIFEICLLTTALQDLITQRKPGAMLRTQALAEGMRTLRHDGWRRVLAGQTTVEEVVRVTSADTGILDE